MNNDEINKDQEETPTIEGEAADKAKTVPAQRRRRAVKESKQTADRPAEETPDATEQEKASSREMLFLKELEKRHREEDDDDDLNIPNVLPVLPLKDTVVYPFAVQPLGVGQDRSIRLIDAVMRGNRLVVLVAQKSAEIELAGPNDIFRVGTVARIARMIRMPDGTLQIIVQGLERVDIGKFTRGKPYLTAHITLKPEIQESDDETEAIKRNVVGYFQRLMTLVQNVREDLATATLNLEEARQVAYVIASIVQMELEMRQKILELDSVRAKLENLSRYLAHELEIFELGRKIQTSAQEEMGKVQREYLLREQLKAIQRELGEESEEQATINELRRKIDEAKLPEEALKEANRELSRIGGIERGQSRAIPHREDAKRFARIQHDTHLPRTVGQPAVEQEHGRKNRRAICSPGTRSRSL